MFSLALRMYAWISTVESGSDLNSAQNKVLDRNTIRSTYPMYKVFDMEYVNSIFAGYSEPKMNYSPFTGWRRKPYSNKAVTVESIYGTRLSENHEVNDSIWFFGGSTMWGTGVDDANTIPSLYAKKTGATVWNLGESAFNSFQEYVQLSKLLVNNLKPKLVVFYDGINEAQYCNTNNKTFPTHVRVEKMQEYMKEYDVLKKRNKELKQHIIVLEKQKNNQVNSILGSFKSIYNYMSDPIVRLYKKSSNRSVLGKGKLREDLKSNIPFSEFKSKGNYKDCDKSLDKVYKAASTTVKTWLMSYSLLKAEGIDLKIILQPTASLKPELLQLEYLANLEKQVIIDEKDSYNAMYKEIRRLWAGKCIKYNACDSLYDISDVFDGLKENIYIDSMHLSPRGNDIVAEKMIPLLD